MTAPVLIFLFGVWFNPNQIVQLEEQATRNGSHCEIILSYGRGQGGWNRRWIKVKDQTCNQVAETILQTIRLEKN